MQPRDGIQGLAFNLSDLFTALAAMCSCCEAGEKEKWRLSVHAVGIPPTLEPLKDSGLYLEPLQDCWHYQEVTWFDLYLINLPLLLLSLSLSPPYVPTFLCQNCLSTISHHPFPSTPRGVNAKAPVSLSPRRKVHNQQPLKQQLSEGSLERAPSHFPHLPDEAGEVFVKSEGRKFLLTAEGNSGENRPARFAPSGDATRPILGALNIL